MARRDSGNRLVRMASKKKERVDSAPGEVKAYKQPSVLRRADAQPFCFGGLQSLWTPPDGGASLRTCAILTRAAPASISSVHDRAPIVLPDELVRAWLDPALQGAPACEELLAHAQTQFVHFPVRTLVNSAKAEGPELVEPIDLQ